MRFSGFIFILFMSAIYAHAETVELDDNALAIYGTACEDIKNNEPHASIRLKAADKACYSAVSTLPEIVDIKDSFEEHDYNVMIYNIVDDYIEDMTTKTIKQDDKQICIEVSGYITPENIGKAIDKTVQNNAENNQNNSLVATNNTHIAQESVLSTDSLPQSETSAPFVVLSTVFIKPTEFYNNTQSVNHSLLLKNILSQSDKLQIVDNEDEANFIITPKVLKAKIEPLNEQTSRMQMVLDLETYDRTQDKSSSEHQNKFVLFNNEDDEQMVAKELLKELFEQSSSSVIKIAEKHTNSNLDTMENSPLLTNNSTLSATTTLVAGGVATDK